MNNLNQNTNLLKLIAILTMIIDHVGAVFFPNMIILRCIGRLGFPLFFYCTFFGYFKTKNLKKYIFRLLLLAIISEIPYCLLFEIKELNICFTLILELLFLYLLDNKKYALYFITLTLSLLLIPFTSYLMFIIIMTPLFYYTKNTKTLFSISYILFYILMVLTGYNKIYLLAILSLPLILFNIKLNVKINKYFFYAFYPVHLLILLIIKIIL